MTENHYISANLQILPEAISTCMKNKEKEQACSYQGQSDLNDCLCYSVTYSGQVKSRRSCLPWLFQDFCHSIPQSSKMSRHGLDGRSTN